MRILLRPFFIHIASYRIFTIEWEHTLTGSSFILRCQITRRIYITKARFTPRQVSILVIKVNSSQRLITRIDTLLRNQGCRRRTASIHTHILHLKLRYTQFRCIPISTCRQRQCIYLLIRGRWSIRANNQIVHLCSITWTTDDISIFFPHHRSRCGYSMHFTIRSVIKIAHL